VKICKNPIKFFEEAKFYLIVTNAITKELTISEAKRSLKNLYTSQDIPFNVLVPPAHESLNFETNIEEFSFVRLKSSSEFKEASQIFRNCLNSFWMYCSRSNVYGIIEKSKLLGVIELQGDIVQQTQFAYNITTSKEEPVRKAFESWVKRNNIKKVDHYSFY